MRLGKDHQQTCSRGKRGPRPGKPLCAFVDKMRGALNCQLDNDHLLHACCSEIVSWRVLECLTRDRCGLLAK